MPMPTESQRLSYVGYALPDQQSDVLPAGYAFAADDGARSKCAPEPSPGMRTDAPVRRYRVARSGATFCAVRYALHRFGADQKARRVPQRTERRRVLRSHESAVVSGFVDRSPRPVKETHVHGQESQFPFAESLGFIRDRFVEPSGFRDVLGMLEDGERLVLVLGRPGTGKSMMLAALAHHLGDAAIGPISLRSGYQAVRDALDSDGTSRVLLVDDLDAPPLAGQEVNNLELLRTRGGRQLVAASNSKNTNLDGFSAFVSLEGPSQQALEEFISRVAEWVPRDEIARTARDALDGAGTRATPPTWRDLVVLLNERFPRYDVPTGPEPSHLFRVDQTSLLGPDGAPLHDTDPRFKAHITRLVEVSEEVLRWLADDPRRARTLSPRDFERVVAELLSRQGYSVELTPATRDGGFDIRAASDSALGSFLYLVECKKYAEDRPVGVGIVRSLHGVVHATGATAGVLVTTSNFTRTAVEFRRTIEHQMTFRDFQDLAKWLRPV